MSKHLLLLLGLVVVGCGSGRTDVYSVRSQMWDGDSIEFHLYETASPHSPTVSLPTITALCRSCNLIDPPREMAFSDSGVARVYMPEALYELDPRIHLKGGGIDTTVILHSRSPDAEASFFHLSQPLIGRVKVLTESPLYASTEQDSTVTFARLGDELNIFGEDPHFYHVHHPRCSEPLFLLRINAVRMY